MNKPHAHAEIIHAYADGAEIEVFDRIAGKWVSARTPAFDVDFRYRIKPAAPIIETKMTDGQIAYYLPLTIEKDEIQFVRKTINMALAKAIADGQIMPVPQQE